MSLLNPIQSRPLAAPIVEVPSWSNSEKTHVVQKCPSSPDIGVQNSFVIATNVRRSPITHEVSDASGQPLCRVKRGGRLRRRRLRRAITTDGRELNWSLYMPKASKGFPRFLWCGGRKSECKETATTTVSNITASTTASTSIASSSSSPISNNGSNELSNTISTTNSNGSYKHKNEADKLGYCPSSPTASTSTSTYPIRKTTSHYDNGGSIIRNEAILAPATAHNRSMSSSTSNNLRGMDPLISLSHTSGFTQLNNNNNYCPLGISSELGVKTTLRNKRQKSSTTTTASNSSNSTATAPYYDNREIIIETRIKEYIKNMKKKPFGNRDTNIATSSGHHRTTSISSKSNNNNNNTNSQDDEYNRLLYFHWKTSEYAWRWNPTTRRLDCLCTRPNHYVNRSTLNTPITTPLRTPQAAMSTPSLSLSSGISPNPSSSSSSTSHNYFSRPTSIAMTSRHSYGSNRGNNGRRRTSLTPTNTTTIIASVGVPLPSKWMTTTTSLEFPEGRCNDADLEQMLLLSCTLLIEQLIRIDMSKAHTTGNLTMNGSTSNDKVSSTTANGRYSMQETISSTVRGRSSFAQSKRLTWFSYRSTQQQQHRSSCDSVDI
ncbi:hypothetical protein BDF22DRAFT_745360 [Syncephalis plumigaleata]|nr:hypothetical protein BDF22DRAFT_745360 [Syncephalis plumigaleata]